MTPLAILSRSGRRCAVDCRCADPSARHFYTPCRACATGGPRRSARRFALWPLLAMGLAAGCDCGGVPEELRVNGEDAYVRCLAVDPPEARRWRIGDLDLSIEGRTLRVRGKQRLRIAAFTGPGLWRGDVESSFARLRAAGPDLALWLGGVGDTPELAARNLQALGEPDFPVLLVAGGRDRWSDVEEALDALDGPLRDRVVNATPLRSIDFGAQEWVLVPGAVGGRYARGPGACGVAEADLERIAEQVEGEPVQTRWLVSWQAPSGAGDFAVTRVGAGLDLGDPTLGQLARRIEAKGGLSAWPQVQAMRPALSWGEARPEPGVSRADLQLVVPPLAGPAAQREDGSRVGAAFAWLEIDERGWARVEQRATGAN